MSPKNRIRVSNLWDARLLLGVFADRGSFLVAGDAHLDVHVTCETGELVERIAGLAPTVSMNEVTVIDGEGSTSKVALAGSRAARSRVAPRNRRPAGVNRRRAASSSSRSKRDRARR